MAALDDLIAERDRLTALLPTLPVAGSMSEGGRSVSVNRQGVLDEIRQLNEMIRELGGPFVILSTGATGP